MSEGGGCDARRGEMEEGSWGGGGASSSIGEQKMSWSSVLQNGLKLNVLNSLCAAVCSQWRRCQGGGWGKDAGRVVQLYYHSC